VKVVITSNIGKVSARYKRIAKAMPQAVERGLEVLADEAIAMHYKTTRTWKKENPKFYWKRTAHGVQILTDSQIYVWVDKGTKGPYPIVPVHAKALRFNTPYKAATKVRVIGSTNANVGKNQVVVMGVMHPGIKARRFTDEIAIRVQKRAANVMRAELDKTINKEAVGL
jgi:hypothetical protein